MKGRVQRKQAPGKPSRPDGFPLFWHQSGGGRWCKVVRGKRRYFGQDRDTALELWLAQKDALLAGREPRAKPDALTVRDLANAFLTSKKLLVEAGELTSRSFGDYHRTCERIVEAFGKECPIEDLGADDLDKLRASIAKKWGAVATGNELGRVRMIFKYAFDAFLVERPVRFGPNFKRPHRRTLRRERAKKGPRLFEARHIRKMIKAAHVQLRAMIYLAVNCGLGNSDLGQLPRRAIDLSTGWLHFARPKTGIDRRVPLWPDTVVAIKTAIKSRPEPKDAAYDDLVFLTRRGQPWFNDSKANPLSREFKKLIDKLVPQSFVELPRDEELS